MIIKLAQASAVLLGEVKGKNKNKGKNRNKYGDSGLRPE